MFISGSIGVGVAIEIGMRRMSYNAYIGFDPDPDSDGEK
jgi:hypothetical protein